MNNRITEKKNSMNPIKCLFEKKKLHIYSRHKYKILFHKKIVPCSIQKLYSNSKNHASMHKTVMLQVLSVHPAIQPLEMSWKSLKETSCSILAYILDYNFPIHWFFQNCIKVVKQFCKNCKVVNAIF